MKSNTMKLVVLAAASAFSTAAFAQYAPAPTAPRPTLQPMPTGPSLNEAPPIKNMGAKTIEVPAKSLNIRVESLKAAAAAAPAAETKQAVGADKAPSCDGTGEYVEFVKETHHTIDEVRSLVASGDIQIAGNINDKCQSFTKNYGPLAKDMIVDIGTCTRAHGVNNDTMSPQQVINESVSCQVQAKHEHNMPSATFDGEYKNFKKEATDCMLFPKGRKAFAELDAQSSRH